MLQTVILLLTLIFTPTWAQPPSRDWFLNFSDLIRDNKVDQAFFADDDDEEPKYKDFLNTPGMGDGTFTSLQWAAKMGSKSWTVEALIDNGGDPTLPHEGTLTTPSMFAAREGNSRTLASILSKIESPGAELSKVDEHGNTALHLAALTTGNAMAATAMLKSTPDHAFALIENNNGNTALQVASFYDSSGSFVSTLLSDEGVRESINKEAPNGRTALHLAIAHGIKDVVEILLKSGAKVDGVAVEIASEKGHEDLEEYLRGDGGEL
ncbi:hypothetical protein TrRE_jg13559 [Triparma retinervis]|uniref:Ankyrin n=1 Tax=Triparma retinervis TaxID=2557542 RepID=A0A9W6ZJC5_9STRA|nr:hypothetical protein TrRE_jg13559 [Triparma retinervis]